MEGDFLTERRVLAAPGAGGDGGEARQVSGSALVFRRDDE